MTGAGHMFDRFTEQARQVIFFARYEASSLGSESIDTEHLLLGVVRQDKLLALRLPRRCGRGNSQHNRTELTASQACDINIRRHAAQCCFHTRSGL